MARSKDILTTGEVAKICKVAPRTVSKWFDSGQLPGYRIPGSKDRRIPLGELRSFMVKHGIPLDTLGNSKPLALVINGEARLDSGLEAVLTQNNFEVQHPESAFAAGVLAERLKPQLVIWDISARPDDQGLFPKDLRVTLGQQKVKLLALTNGQHQNFDLQKPGFDACLSKPLDGARLTNLLAQWAFTGSAKGSSSVVS